MFDFLNADSNIFLILLILVVGFVLIIYGGDFFVDSAIWFAKITHVPQLIIGATIVSIGTTLPEVFVSYMSAAQGQTSMAVGNAEGSILCNFALIFGITLCAFSSVSVNKKQFLQKFIILTVAVLLNLVFALDGKIAIWEGIILLCIFALFMTLDIISAVRRDKQGLEPENPEEDEKYRNKKPWLMIVLFFLGAAGIACGASFLIDSISALAEKANISQQIISLTVVALGTSLPELVTALTSLKKNHTEISMGNILGANILNASLILGGSAIIAGGIDVAQNDKVSLMASFIIIFALIAVLFIPVFIKNKTYRWQGIVFESIYALYLAFLVLQLTGVIPYTF